MNVKKLTKKQKIEDKLKLGYVNSCFICMNCYIVSRVKRSDCGEMIFYGCIHTYNRKYYTKKEMKNQICERYEYSGTDEWE